MRERGRRQDYRGREDRGRKSKRGKMKRKSQRRRRGKHSEATEESVVGMKRGNGGYGQKRVEQREEMRGGRQEVEKTESL